VKTCHCQHAELFSIGLVKGNKVAVSLVVVADALLGIVKTYWLFLLQLTSTPTLFLLAVPIGLKDRVSQ
jgi:uncharacterized membrane protein YpjA